MQKSNLPSTVAPILVASILNFLFLAFVIYLAVQEVPTYFGPATRWELFLTSPPNEIGDTLAGVFGSMTLIWIVASVFQQSMELRAQRQEFAEMVAAQEAQVRALDAQADIFRDEKRRADEKEATNNFNNTIRFMLERLLAARCELVKTDTDNTDSSLTVVIASNLKVNFTSDGYRENDATIREIFASIKLLMRDVHANKCAVIARNQQAKIAVSDFIKELRVLQSYRPRLSQTALLRLQRIEDEDAFLALEGLEGYLETRGATGERF